MNKSLKRVWWFLGFILLINLVVLALLFWKPEPKGIMGKPRDVIPERLRFSPEQKEIFHKEIEAHKANVQAIERQRKKLKDKLFRSLAEEPYRTDSATIIALGEIQNQIEYLHVAHLAGIKEICTEDQLELYYELARDFGRIFDPRRLNKVDSKHRTPQHPRPY